MDAAEALTLLMSPQGRVDPYPTYERLRAHGPVVQAMPGLYVVTGYPEVDELLRDPRLGVLDDALRDQVWPNWRESPAVSRSPGRCCGPTRPTTGGCVGSPPARSPRAGSPAMRDVVPRQAEELLDWMAKRPGRRAGRLHGRVRVPAAGRRDLRAARRAGADRPLVPPRAGDLTGVLEPELTPEELTGADAGRRRARASTSSSWSSRGGARRPTT